MPLESNRFRLWLRPLYRETSAGTTASPSNRGKGGNPKASAGGFLGSVWSTTHTPHGGASYAWRATRNRLDRRYPKTPETETALCRYMPSLFRVQRSTHVRLSNLIDAGRVTSPDQPSAFVAARRGAAAVKKTRVGGVGRFVGVSTRAAVPHPHGGASRVQTGNRNRTGRHSRVIERFLIALGWQRDQPAPVEHGPAPGTCTVTAVAARAGTVSF